MFLNKEVGLDDVMQIIAEKLEAGGSVTFNPKGTSMLPMLRDGDDTVVLSKPKGRLAFIQAKRRLVCIAPCRQFRK